jgi:hypothetical protein
MFRKQFQSKISNKFASLDNLYDGENITRAWKNIEEKTPQLKIVQFCCINRSSINRGLIKNV